MLISDDPSIAFVHIPKSAGTSVRKLFSQRARPLPELYQHPSLQFVDDKMRAVHEELGSIHLHHLPLAILKNYFPDAWQLLVGRTSLAIVRDPVSRFESAVKQRLREFRGVGFSDLDPTSVNEEAKRVCDWLSGREVICDLEYVHFSRQQDFIEVDGERIVDRIFAIERLDLLMTWMGKHFAFKADQPEENRSSELAKWLRPLAGSLRETYRWAVPSSVRNTLIPVYKRLGMIKAPASSEKGGALSNEVVEFINGFYASDFALRGDSLLDR